MLPVPLILGVLDAPKAMPLVQPWPNAHHNYILPLVRSFVGTLLLNLGILNCTGVYWPRTILAISQVLAPAMCDDDL
jgi:hypothetical protein